MQRKTIRAVLATSAVIAVGVPSVAVGFGEGKRLKLGERNPSPNASRALNAETEIIADNATYGTRQSNKRDGRGGGAIYGCRSAAGFEPCVRANNLKGGRAFEFVTAGKEAGLIQVGDTTGAPFTTNAAGVATGLNADKVDGHDAEDFAAAGDLLFAVVDAGRQLRGARGAESVAVSDADANRVAVTFAREVAACSFTAAPAAEVAAPLAVAAGADPKVVEVDAPGSDPVPFHLQVVC